MTLQDFRNATAADVNVSGFSVTANASKTDGDVNDLATPRIRVRNKEKAKILVGTRNPVVSSAATPALAGGGATVFNTSVTYIETGIKVEVEPDIHPDGEVAIKLNLEVSSAGAQINTGSSGTVAFPINTNNVTTLLQLKDGETQILGGLMQTQNDQSQSKIPGAGDVPGLGRLFGVTKDTWNKTELLLAITPHIVRNASSDQADLMEMWSGTDAQARFGSPNVRAAAGSGVMGQSSAPGPVSAAPLAPAPSPRPQGTAPAAILTPGLQGPSQANVGEKLSISMGITGGPALSAIAAVLRYDAALLRAVNVVEGDVLKKSATQSKFDGSIDEAAGTVTMHLSATDTGTAAGGGNLAVINFEVLASGSANVGIKSLTASTLGGGPVQAATAIPLQIVVP
ncbi:MAG: cohesin domain-containing protein [Rhodoferax sp.]